MPNASLRIAALLALACAIGPVAAQPPGAPEEQRVLRLEWEQNFQRQKPVPVVPAPLRQTVSATNEWVTVRMDDGSPFRVGIGALTVDQLESFQNGRFIGFGISGNEEYGYILIDRMGRDHLIESHTDSRPSFAEDGRHFAAAEISESGFGNLNGVALWEVLPAGVKRLFYTDSVRGGFNWRAEPFRGSNCVPITAVQEGWTPTTPDRWDAEVGNAPRAWYELRWSADEGLYFGRSSDAACFDDSSG